MVRCYREGDGYIHRAVEEKSNRTKDIARFEESFGAGSSRHGWRRFRVFANACMVSHSAAMARPISSGVLLTIGVPFSLRRRCSSGSFDAWMKVSRILATSAGGMPAGPPSANQLATRSLV